MPVTVGDRTLGVWVAEFKMTDETEADVIDAVATEPSVSRSRC